LRDGRFGNWVENARDWAISRSRFWGTPLPVWRNEDGETVCIGSVKELEDLSGVKGIKDLHSHFVDSIEIPSRQGGAPLKRVEGVLDCWFESGAMPMAQCGYPFDEKNKQRFEQGFPADFIAEGLDQTRGWFYTLMVIASALWEKPAFQHVIVNGLVLAEDGKKMSKRLRNYPDPSLVLEKYGADALRLYLMDSPVVKAQDLRFSEKGVSDIVRRILLRWWNAYGFFVTYANADGFIPRGLDEAGLQPEDFRLLDRWILSRLSDLTATVHREMQAYRLYSVVPALLKFIDDLTNIYIRFNRREFWQEGMPKSKLAAFETMYRVLWDLSHLMAPWTPFLAESMYQNLRRVRPDAPLSVHLGAQPQSENRFDTETLEKTMPVLLDLIELGRSIRQQAKIKTKIPLPMATVFHQDSGVLEALRQLEPYWLDELNVQQVVYRTDEDAVVRRSTRASYARLGKRLGARMKEAAERLSSLSPDELSILEAGGEIAWHGELFTREDIETRRELLADPAVAASSQYIALILDTRVDTQALAEGVAREVIRRIQTARKNAQLRVEQRIHLHLGADGELGAIIQKFRSKIDEEVLCIGELAGSGVSYKESFELDEGVLEVGLRVADGDV
jgi:isoleucyl-tRNA synthetase